MINKNVVNISFLIMMAVFSIAYTKAEDCGQEELISCSKQLEVLSSTTSELSFVTKKEELDKICPDLHTGLNCIRSYTRRCMDMKQREHFNKLYNGTNHMIHELCEQGKFQEDFLRHAPCMRHVKKDYEICTMHYHNKLAQIGASEEYNSITSTTPTSLFGNENTGHTHGYGHGHGHEHAHGHKHHHQHNNNTTTESSPEIAHIKTVCCAFQNYVLCSEKTVRLTCGVETATFTKSFLDKMSSTMMRMHCENYSVEKCSDDVVYSNSNNFRNQLTNICIALYVFKFYIFNYA